MADTKLSALAALAVAPASDDEVYIRDVSEAAAAESKRITLANLAAYNPQVVRATPFALDLSGANIDEIAFTPLYASILLGYRILYTETSSADAGVELRVGKLIQDGTFDDDFYDQTTSEINKTNGYSLSVAFGSLDQSVIAVGETVTVGCIGGKTGAGEVILFLFIARS